MACTACCQTDSMDEVSVPGAMRADTPGFQNGGTVGLPEPIPVLPPTKEPAPSEPEPANNAEVLDKTAPPPAPSDSGEDEFIVELEKTAAVKKVGLDVDHGDEKTLEVMMVKDGLVQMYNQTAPYEKQIKTGDRIVDVNGVTNDSKKMLETVGREQKLRFVVKRGVPS